MHVISSTLKHIDQFGLPIQITYKNEPTHRTPVGGLMTICLTAVFIIAIYYFGKEVINHETPTTIFNQEFQEHPAQFEISPKSFPFAFGLQDGTTWAHYIDDSIYTVQASTYVRRKVLNKQTGISELIEESFPVNVGPCNVAEDLSVMEATIDYFLRLDVSQMFCIKKDQQFVPQIEGQWDASVFKGVYITFSGCKNRTHNGKQILCQPQEVIDQKLSSGYFAMNYVDMTVNLLNAQHPYKYFGKDFYTYTSNLVTKNVDFFLKRVEMVSDEGWLFEDIKKQQGVAYGEVKDMLDLRKNDNFVNFSIRLQSKSDIYTRFYKKIQHVMAEVGGFLKSILIFFLILLFPYSQINFYVDLLNQLFIFDSYQEKLSRKSIHESQLKKFSQQQQAQEEEGEQQQKNCQNQQQKQQLQQQVTGSPFQQEIKAITNNNNINDDEIQKDCLHRQHTPPFQPHQQNQPAPSEYNTDQQKSEQCKNAKNKKRQSTYLLKLMDAIQGYQQNQEQQQQQQQQTDNNINNNDQQSQQQVTMGSKIAKQKSKNINNNNRDSQQNNYHEELLQMKQGGLSLSFLEQIGYFFCPTRNIKKKMHRINVTIERIKEHLDVVYILNKLQEIDKIKMLLLSPQQIQLFDLLSKPIINLDEPIHQSNHSMLQFQSQFQMDDNEINYLSVLNEEKSHFQKIIDAYKIYEQIDDKNMDKQDKKLFDLMDENIRHVFQKIKLKKQRLTQDAGQSQQVVGLVSQPKFSQIKFNQQEDEIMSNQVIIPEDQITDTQRQQLYIFDNMHNFSQKNNNINNL